MHQVGSVGSVGSENRDILLERSQSEKIHLSEQASDKGFKYILPVVIVRKYAHSNWMDEMLLSVLNPQVTQNHKC